MSLQLGAEASSSVEAALGDERDGHPRTGDVRRRYEAASHACRRSRSTLPRRERPWSLDCVTRKAEAFRVEQFSRRRRIVLDGHEIWMVSSEDLILPESVWGHASHSDVQVRDVRAVIAAQAGHLDWTYLETWAAALEVAEALRRSRS